MDFRQAIGLLGIVLAAVAAQLNDQVLVTALPDIAGHIGISSDSATWLRTLFITGQVIGMCSAPSLGLGFSFRHFALFAIALNCFPTMMMALGGGGHAAPLLILRSVQGLASGFTIPLLMTIALRVLGPDIRLYGLAIYAMTATLTPNLATSFAALWIDGVRDWRFVFLECVPFCALAAVCVWWGLDQDPPKYERLRKFDWWGVILVAIGFGSLSIVLEQGDRLDWYHSPLIAVLTLVSGIAIPLFFWVETQAEVPLMDFSLLKRRNFLYPVLTLILFLVIALSASQVPLNFLEQVRGYKPIQVHWLTLDVALAQIVLLPLTALLLDHRHVDARWVNAVGFACILGACFGAAHVSSAWGLNQFYVWQALQAVGFAFVVMPLLMIATNSITPDEGPYGSALVNTPRAIAEGIGVWLVALIERWRGALHRDRIVDLIGQQRIALSQASILPPANSPASGPALQALDHEVTRQVTTLVTIDTYAIMGCLVVLLMIALALLPTRTLPPRLELAK